MTVDDLIEILYGLPLAEFTGARDRAVRELRKAGKRDEADRVKAVRKPSVAAAHVNRLVREQRPEVEAFLAAAAALRDAQVAGKGSLRAAAERERDALERLLRAGGEAVRQTLLAAAVDDEAAGQLLSGRLERELEPRGFGTLLAHAKPLTANPAAANRAGEPKRADDRAARARLREASEALSAAELAEREAQRHLAKARRAVADARAAAEEAERELDRLHGR